MSLTIESDGITIYDCENLLYAVGKEAILDSVLVKQNLKSLSAASEDPVPEIGYHGPIPDLTDKHVRAWYLSTSFPNIDIKDNGGISLYAIDNLGDEAYWYISGSDIYAGGWINILVNMSITPDIGSVDTANIVELGVTHRSGGINGYLTKPRKVVNVWLDYIRHSDGLVCYGLDWDIHDICVANNAPGVGFGIVTGKDDIDYVSGSLIFGKLDTPTRYNENNSTIVFTNDRVRSNLFGIKFIGDSTNISQFEISNSVLLSSINKFYLDFDDTNISKLVLNRNLISGASDIHLLANAIYSTVTNNIFNNCGTIHPQGSRFENNSIHSTTSDIASVRYSTVDSLTASKDIVYTKYFNKYAIHIAAEVSGTITLDAHIFDKSGIDIYWAGTVGVLTIKLVNNSNASTYNTAGGTIEFVVVDNIAIDYDIVNGMIGDSNTALTNMMTSNNENLNQLLIALGDKVSENQSTIVSKSGNTQMLL